MFRQFPVQPLLVMLSFALIITVPQWLPCAHNWHVYEWPAALTLFDFLPRERPAASESEEAERMRPTADSKTLAAQRILDGARSLDPFYAALWRVERGEPGAVVRILHYGDSPTTADHITADLRGLLQQRFGDAGHGVHLIAKPWAWYEHRGISCSGDGWHAAPATLREMKDGWYGLGGVSFIGRAGAASRYRFRAPGYTRIRLDYVALPRGGVVEIYAGDRPVAAVDTDMAETKPVHADFNLPPDAAEVRLKVARAPVRLFEVAFEKDGPGIVYSSLGMNGAFAGVMANYVNEAHWAAQLKEARPDLVVVNYGTNESVYPKYVDSTYPPEFQTILRRLKRALPGVSVLVMSPMDRGQREAGGAIGSVPVMTRLVALQAKLAAEEECGFFNTFEAMGGPGTMGRWYMAEPRLVNADFIHPMPAGGKIIAGLLYRAMLDGFNLYKLRRFREGLMPGTGK